MHKKNTLEKFSIVSLENSDGKFELETTLAGNRESIIAMLAESADKHRDVEFIVLTAAAIILTEQRGYHIEAVHAISETVGQMINQERQARQSQSN